MPKPNDTWTTLRTFAAAAADSTGLPALTDYTDLPGVPAQGHIPKIVELMIDNAGATPTTTGSPVSVIIKLYRQVDGKVSLIYTWTISQTDITNSDVVPIMVEAYGQRLYPKVSYNGGTAPTLTATVRARAVE